MNAENGVLLQPISYGYNMDWGQGQQQHDWVCCNSLSQCLI